MKTFKSTKRSCRDVFNAFLIVFASCAGFFEIPVIRPTHEVPNRVVLFSKAISCKDYDQWVHFYEFDYQFERIWRNPRRYLPILQRFNGVILPDFSLYRDMPLVMQLWNIYRSRAIGCWLQQNGVKVIVNVRWGDCRTHRVCCDGAPRDCTISVGTVGALDDAEDRAYFVEGLDYVVRRLRPTVIVVYGAAPEEVFGAFRDAGIDIVQFDCETTVAHSRRREVA